MSVRFGSVCSGIEAASVAWHPLGWQAAWLSEIEPFPCAVLKHHYPDVPNLGDMTILPERILSGEVEAPDVFCGGTPCQAFSVAGLRKSLEDARGNLSLTFIGIANAIDHVRSVRSDPPVIIFWENVPGVLSTKDNAFGCFLGALAGEDDPLVPPGGKWANAGCVYGPQRAVAWRVLDAQYFGVAQRRRRVFVVASSRDGFDPAAVLFEFEGVRRDSAPSREAGKESATRTGFSITGSVTGGYGPRLGTDESCQGSVISQPIAWDNDLNASIEQVGTLLRGGAGGRHDGVMQPVGFTRCDHGGDAVVDGAPTMRCGSNYSAHLAVAFHPTQDPISSADVCHSIGTGNGQGCATAAVMQAIPIDSMNHLGRGDAHSFGDFQPGAPSYTLTKGHSHAVAVAPTLTASNDPSRSPQSSEITAQVAAVAANTMQVRRLTPVECERLQGFPDNYTAIPWRGKAETPDGPRYKALGNSWAVPVVQWIGNRIQHQLSLLNNV